MHHWHCCSKHDGLGSRDAMQIISVSRLKRFVSCSSIYNSSVAQKKGRELLSLLISVCLFVAYLPFSLSLSICLRLSLSVFLSVLPFFLPSRLALSVLPFFLMCSFNSGNIHRSNSSKICFGCLCMFHLFYICVRISFVD